MDVVNAGGCKFTCPKGHTLTMTVKDFETGWSDCPECVEPFPKEDWIITKREDDSFAFAARVSAFRSYVEQEGMPGEAEQYEDLHMFHAPSECGGDVRRGVRRRALEELFAVGLSLDDFLAAMSHAVALEDDGVDEPPLAYHVQTWVEMLQHE